MNPVIENSRKFSTYRYSGMVANSLWTIQWLIAAILAIQRLQGVPENWDRINVIIALFCALAGCALTYRAFPRGPELKDAKKYPVEPWHRRITGWLALVVWCGFGVIWNTGTAVMLWSSAYEGRPINVLIAVPFSLIGWFLLLMICVTITMAFDSMVEKMREVNQWPPRDDTPGDGR